MIDYRERVLSAERAESLCREWKDSGEIVVFTNGCFDLLHVGHLQTLTRAKAEGTKLVVGVNSDSSVKRLKGPRRPIHSEADRALLLAGLRCVDAVVVFSEDTPVELLERVRPNVHVKGGDYREEDLPEAAVVKSHGGRIVLIDLVPGRSTTAAIEKSQNS